MRHLDLFSGIGGFSLSASWVWGEDHHIHSFVEIDPFCQKVLKKHWPNVPIHSDIKEYKHDGTAIDLLTGGFPCQDVSCAGKQSGLNGSRSGLWKELHNIIRQVRPKYTIIENVSNLLNGGNGRWFETVLFDLASIRYDAEWHCIPASAVSAPHIRDRIWIIAYPQSDIAETSKRSVRPIFKGLSSSIKRVSCWKAEPKICRVDDGLSRSVDSRNKSLGNAIVPQVVMPIMQAIKQIEESN